MVRDELPPLEPAATGSNAVGGGIRDVTARRAVPWYRVVVVALLALIAFQQYQFNQYLDRAECLSTAYLEQPMNRLQSWRNDVVRKCGLAPVLPPADVTEQQE